MNILILNWRDITHPWTGGAERHLHELAKSWVKKGDEVMLLVGGYKNCVKKETIEGINIIRVGNTYSIFFVLPLYFLTKLRKTHFDCLVDCSHGIPFFTPLYYRGLKILIIHHNHRKLWLTEFNNFISKIGIFLENRIVPLVYKNTAVITLSNSSKKELRQLGFKRVYSIAPGIDHELYKYNKEKFSTPTILYLGRLRKYKRVDILIDAYETLKKRVSHLNLIIVGVGQDKSRLEYLARKKGIYDQVEFKGFVSESEKISLLNKSWILAFPSLVEGWGLVALEAAACGTPTVGFKVEGLIDAVKDGTSGVLVKNKKEFTETLVNVLKDKKYRNKLSKGSTRWAAQFNWGSSQNEFYSIIMKLASQKSTNGLYSKKYFSSFWRGSSKRSFHPIYDFRAWYIAKYLKPSSLLDVGCGSGLILNKLKAKGIRVRGMDISKAALLAMPKDLRDQCYVGDINNIPEKSNKYDIISCIDVLEHVPSESVTKAIKECARVARRMIYFDITSLEDIFFIHSDKTHVTKKFSWEWEKILKQTLNKNWAIKRGPIIPFIHHSIFIAEKYD